MRDKLTAHIIGQSNSVMKDGFARQMQRLGIINVREIKAIGASASLLANFFIEGIDERSADYCILDLAVFDRYLVYIGCYKFEHMEAYLGAAIVDVMAKGMEPVLLLIPDPKPNERTAAVYRSQTDVAIRHNCLYFDGGEWFSRLRDGVDLSEVFSDPNHFTARYSEMFAESLSLAIARFHTSTCRMNVPHPATSVVRRVEAVSAQDHVRSDMIRRASSSAMTLSLVRIDASNQARVHVGTCERVCGVVVDAMACTGKLVVSGRGAIVKDLGLSKEASRLTFVARVVPLTGDVADIDGYIGLSIASDDADPTEATAGSPSSDAAPGFIHISHVLVERPERSITYQRRFLEPSELDLVRLQHAD
jgi:hypothetical protein